MARVRIDPNVRVRGNGTYSGVEDVYGVLVQGDEVVVFEPEANLVGKGRVSEIDLERQLVYLAVDWSSLQVQESGDLGEEAEDVLQSVGQVLAGLASRRENSVRPSFGASCHLPGGAYYLGAPRILVGAGVGPRFQPVSSPSPMNINATRGNELVA